MDIDGESDDQFDQVVKAPISKKKAAGGKNRLSVERIYQKKSQLEHILLRPDTYIGSIELVTQNMWVYDGEEVGMVNREISFVPGLYKIFDEILVNAADNKQRDKKMDTIKIDIDPASNKIRIWNNGEGIPVVEHKDEKMFVPTMIFGHLLTSSNYNDEEQKVTGGRNGYGAKLCNIFSTKFIVETAYKQSKKNFKQVWTDNMSNTSEPTITPYGGEDFTCITFYPDLPKFKMASLDNDTIALMSRRAYDIAGASRGGVKVFLNGKRLPVKGFKDYIEQYLKNKEDETGNPLKVVYENAGDRWEVGIALSVDKGFQQMSFVNSIATTKGGRHVDHVADIIVSKVIEMVKKKNKGGISVKPFQIKNHIWVFVNCLIVNPTFDSQTKENMTLQMKSFGSKCVLSEKFLKLVLSCGIVESVMNWVKFKTDMQLNKKCSNTKHSKLKGIPKLEDANDAGTRLSADCTLILTEGDSAKTLAVSGLGVIGRDKYGVFPLRGKMLNVREATQKQILENAEINNVIKILGLQYRKKYETMDDIKKLRYGRLMIMTDQDQDGSHIKGLLINFIHHNWPSLLRLPFLEEFITPIVKASKGNEELNFYSLPEFEEWKTNTPNWNKYKVKYYKGLGTSTAKEAKEYFSDMIRHRIKFKYQGTEDDDSIQLAFSKKMIEQRKEWLTNGMEERKQRRELGLPEMFLYGKTTTAVTYSEFVNKELILFSNTDNERSIPSLVDGFKPGQRKVIFTCIKRNDKREVKVAQLAGSVAEHSAYHHGEASLMGTIIGLAQNYVGSNNINLLQPIGQFGTRLQGGKDSASPRYIFTMLSPLAKHIISPLDEPLLNHLKDDNQKIEPEYYVPIIPMVLVNGAEGIGTGWSTKIPNYDPREIIKNLERMLDGEEPKPMEPWYKNFRGTIEKIDEQHYVISGECSILESNKFEITELPVRVWTQAYKENVLETMLHGDGKTGDKTAGLITDYKEYTTDTTVRFVVTMLEQNLARYEANGLHRLMKLQSILTSNSMVLFDTNGILRRYSGPDEILREFFTLRLSFYVKRKTYLEGVLEAEASKLSNQARFILEKIEGKIILEDRKKASVIKVLQERGYDSDPVKIWKETQDKLELDEATANEDNDDEDNVATLNGAVEDGAPDYNYLLQMSLLSLTREVKDDLLKKKDNKLAELKNIQKQSPSDLWRADLNTLLVELDIVEEKEREDELGSLNKLVKGKGAKGKSKNQVRAEESKPSKFAERIIPTIDPETQKKIDRLVIPDRLERKERKQKKKLATNAGVKKEALDDDDDADVPSLSERIGNSPEKMEKELEKGKKKTKQSTLNFKPAAKKEAAKKDKPKKNSPKKESPKKKKKNPWSEESGSDEDGNISDCSDLDAGFMPEPRALSTPPPTRRAAANKKYTIQSDDEISDEADKYPVRAKGRVSDDEEEIVNGNEDKKTNGATVISSDSDSEGDRRKDKGDAKEPSSDALFDSLLGGGGDNDDSTPEKKSAATSKPARARSDSGSSFELPDVKTGGSKRKNDSDDDFSADEFQPKVKKAAPVRKRGPQKSVNAKKAPAKAKVDSDDSDSDAPPPLASRIGRAKP